jgi:hypothetical protein
LEETAAYVSTPAVSATARLDATPTRLDDLVLSTTFFPSFHVRPHPAPRPLRHKTTYV